MTRPVRSDDPGAVSHVICRGNNGRAVFRDDEDRRWYLEALSLDCEERRVGILSYCLLGDQVHLLLETAARNLSMVMETFHARYTVYFNRRHGCGGHVFAQPYKVFSVDKDNYLLGVTRYIHLNPVSARIVDRPQDYQWSSYGSYLKGKGISALKCETVFGYFRAGRRGALLQYRRFVEGKPVRDKKLGEPEAITGPALAARKPWKPWKGRGRSI